MARLEESNCGGIRMAEELYVYDKISGHLFCKYCGMNYLTKRHKEDCRTTKEDNELPTRPEVSD